MLGRYPVWRVRTVIQVPISKNQNQMFFLFHELDPELGSRFNLCVELEPKPRLMFLKSLKLVVNNRVTINSSLS